MSAGEAEPVLRHVLAERLQRRAAWTPQKASGSDQAGQDEDGTPDTIHTSWPITRTGLIS